MSKNNYDFGDYILPGDFAELFRTWFNDMVHVYGWIAVSDVKECLYLFSDDPRDPTYTDYMYGWTNIITCENFEEYGPKRSLIPMYKLRLPEPKKLE